MMDESNNINNTRRRRGVGTTQHNNNHNSTTSLEIPNGSAGCYYYDHRNQQQQQQQQQQLDVLVDDDCRNRSSTNNNKKKTKKKLKSRHNKTTARKKKKRRSAVGGGSSDCDDDHDYYDDDNDNDDDDLPFGILVIRVGFVVILIFITFFSLYRYISPAASPPSIGDFYDDDDDFNDYNNNGNYQQQQQDDDVVLKKNLGVQQELHPVEEVEEDHELPPPPPLPVWNLTAKSKYDPYGIAEQLNVDSNNNNNNNAEDQSKSTKRKRDAFWKAANGLRERFAENYGGVNAARAILERGLSTFDDNNDNIRVTACRLLHARDVENRSFNFAFGGYSVTAGRGNYFSQSYPFVMEKLLHTAFHLLDMKLSVINAAIGGSSAFPYGFCMNNFWGSSEPLDVVNWDFSMNEAVGDNSVKNPAAGFEAYIRHVLQLSNNNNNMPPKLIVKDTHMAIERRNVLQQYVQHKQLHDPVVIHTDPAAAPFLEIQEELHRPNGFQQWRQFGGPPGSPGQVSHHPAVKEHEFIAFILTMHFLSALQLVAAHDDDVISAGGSSSSSGSNNILQCNNSSDDGNNNNNKEETHLITTTTPAIVPVPDEVINNTNNDRNMTKQQQQKPWSSLLYGEPITTNSSSTDVVKNSGGRTWIMNPVHCRTSYEPIRQGPLSDIIMSGSVGEDIDVMYPKSGYYYNRGWVLDISDPEKKAKHKLDGFGGGFLDSKKAYYGLYSSGPLRLFLPYEPSSSGRGSGAGSPQHHHQPKVGDRASQWFKSVVLCEVNEKRAVVADDVDFGAPCNSEMDTSYTVGGVNITNSSKTMIDTVGSLFMGKKLCMYLPVPASARLTTRGSLQQKETRKQHLVLLAATEEEDEKENQVVGLAVDVRVHNQHIMRQQQACSISHAIWEQQQQHPQKS